MNGGLSSRACELLLRSTFADRQFFVGLALGAPKDEVADRNYVRQEVLLGTPEDDTESRLRFVSNTNTVRFGPWSVDSPTAVSWWLFSDSARTREPILATEQLMRTRVVMAGDELVFRPGELRIGFRYST